MTDVNKVFDARRRLLRSLAASGGVAVTASSLPNKWAKPVADSVLLSAHAQTTDRGVPGCDDGWINGDAESTGGETYVGDTATRCACEDLVRISEPTADGATWGPSDGSCYAEFGWALPAYITKQLSVTDCDSGWDTGDAASTGGETNVGNTGTRCACDELVRTEEPSADGATWAPGNGSCYAEFGWEPPAYITKQLN